MTRSTPPVLSSEVVRLFRSVASGRVLAAKECRSLTSGSVRTSAGRPVTVALPRLLIAGRAACENGPSWRISRLISGAAVLRSRATGAASPANPPRSFIAGRSCSRNPGRSRIDRSMSARRAAVASAVRLAETTKPDTLRLSRASGASTWSESPASFASTWFWRARTASTLSVSRNAGLARWMTSLRSLPRPATPVPNSPSRMASRSRYGRRRMSLTRSRSTGELVFFTPSRYWPSPGPSSMRSSGGDFDVPGLHSTNFSPISDCGRTVQLASLRNGANRMSSIFRTTAALLSGVTSIESISPTRAPATFTSSPGTAAATLSKIARTW